jgi:hypothetical protein
VATRKHVEIMLLFLQSDKKRRKSDAKRQSLKVQLVVLILHDKKKGAKYFCGTLQITALLKTSFFT